MRAAKPMTLRACVIAAALLVLVARQGASQQVPPAASGVAQDTLHGTVVPDRFRTLESDSGEAAVWVRQVDSVSRAWLESGSDRAAIAAYLDKVRPRGTVSAPHVRDGYAVFVRTTRNPSGAPGQQLVRRDPSGRESILLDAASFGPTAAFATYPALPTPSMSVSTGGRFVAMGIVDGNATEATWVVYDLRAGRLTADRLSGLSAAIFTVLAWTPDDEGFFYYIPARRAVLYHQIGTDQRTDTVTFVSQDTTAYVLPSLTPDGRTLALRLLAGPREGLLLQDVGRPGSTRVSAPMEKETYSVVGGVDGQILLRTTYGAPTGRLVLVDPQNPQRTHWRTVVDPRPDATMVGVDQVGDYLVLQYTRGAWPEVEIRPAHRLSERRAVRLPYVGWNPSGFIGGGRDNVAGFDLQGTADPGSSYLLNVATGHVAPFAEPHERFDASDYVTEERFYPSAGGAQVPITLMYRRGLAPSERKPTWLYAYGAGWAALPWYQVQHRLWLDLGGVYALAHVRGGGELGQEWIDAGSGVNKERGIDDYLAAAEWLVAEGLTSPRLLVANGGSASAPLVAAALNRRPDLFGATLIDYGFLDLVRGERWRPNAAAPAGNWGSVSNAAEFRAILRWSPYHNVVRGGCYPPTLVSHGDQDQFARAWHSYKYVAALREAQGCDKPVLLQVPWGGGHTVGGAEERINQIAFLVRVLNLNVPESWRSMPRRNAKGVPNPTSKPPDEVSLE